MFSLNIEDAWRLYVNQIVFKSMTVSELWLGRSNHEITHHGDVNKKLSKQTSRHVLPWAAVEVWVGVVETACRFTVVS